MRRREFIALLGGAALACPRLAAAQDAGLRRIGVLMSATENDPEYQANLDAFRDALRRLGWIVNRNIRIDYRFGAVDDDSARRLAQELLALRPDAVVAQNTPTSIAMLQQTRTVPVIFATVVDPVGSGLVASLAQPGGNVTGFITIEGSLAGKWIELLKEIAPRVTRVAFLYNPTTASFADYYLGHFKAAAASVGVEAIVAPAKDLAELEATIAAHARAPDGGLIAMPDVFLNLNRIEVTSIVARHRLPAVYPYRFFAEVGGLMSYGNNLTENYPRVAGYVDRVLRGAKPSELPVQQPTKFEMVVNARTARALGLDVPASFYWRADEVIE